MKTVKVILPVFLAVFVAGNHAFAQKETPKKNLVKDEKLDRSKRPVAGPAPEIKMGEAKSFTLPNGLKVFVVENHKIPRVSFSVNFDVDPFTSGDKKGYVDFTGELLGTATTTMTKSDINKKVDFIGASLNTSGDGVSGACLKKHSAELLAIMSDVLLNAKFTQEELDKSKSQAMSGLSTVKSDAGAMMGNLQNAMFFGKDHPYGEVQKPEHLKNVTLADCENYYKSYMRPNVSYLTIVGDVTLEEAKKWVETYFGKWEKGEVNQNIPQAVKGPQEVIVAMVDKPGAPQSAVHIGYPINYKPGQPDDASVKLLNEVLGGGASARLFENIRETYNYSYGAYSYFRSDEFAGQFVCFADVRTAATDSAIVEFMKELGRITAEPVTQKELNEARNNLAGTFSISLEKPATVAQFALNIEKYGLPADYYKNYLKRLEAVTTDDVLAAAKKYVSPGKIYILVVGDKEKLEPKLKRFATSGKIQFYDAFGDAATALKKAPDGVTGTKVLDNYVNAIGGKKALAKVKDETMEMVLEIQGQKIVIASKKKVGGMLLETQTMGPMTLGKKVSDGKKAKSTSMMGGENKDSYTAEEMAELKRDAEIYPELKYAEWGYTMNLLGVDNIDGKEVYKVEIIHTGKEEKTFEYYDVATGLKVRTEQNEKGPDGTSMLVIIDYSDYRDVSGIKYPHAVTINQGGQLLPMKLTKIELNKKLKSDTFKVE